LNGKLAVLSAGAAQSVVTALAAQHGIDLQAEFGPVGAMRQRLLDGAPCELIVLTRQMILGLGNRVVASADIGRVGACIAVRESDESPRVDTKDLLHKALSSADAIYLPDPAVATAGAHFKKVLDQLNISRGLKIFPSGSAAMHALASAPEPKAIGCTQATEIMATPGAKVVAPLPAEFALSTTYGAAICRDSAPARRFFELLTGEASRDLRMKAGFEL
jgi:molybdate transport system substrate-binding protein